MNRAYKKNCINLHEFRNHETSGIQPYKNIFVQMKITIIVLLSFIFFIGSLTIFNSCTHEPLGLDKFDTICFSKDVLPIFQNSCGKVGCHDGSEEGFDARSYESIMQSITPGNAQKSDAYRAITSVYFNTMPPSPNAPLTKEQRTLIATWINQGAMKTICESSPVPPDNGNSQSDTVCFSQTILPVLQSNCAVTGCHDPVTKIEGLNLSSYATIMSKSETVVPFNPGESKIYQSIIKLSGEDRMPPYPRARLTSTQIQQINTWISEGALNSNCPDNACDTLNTISFSTQVWPIIQNSCLGCHNTSAASGNINLNGHTNILAVAGNVVNGTSLLSGVINQKAGFKAMPPYGTKMNVCKIRTIDLWIQQGMLNN
jgi:uncharacterized membrane protein